MISAAPSTTSSAAAVITSRALDSARILNTGFSTQRPAKITVTIEAAATPTLIQRCVMLTSVSTPGDSSATTASSGTMARSSSSSTETIFCPAGVCSSPRSDRICMTMAVEVRTNPMPATNATAGASPSRKMPASVSSSPHRPTCRMPNPKISLRSPQSLAGSISSPTMNRNSTTPSSAACSTACGSPTSFSPNGPMTSPAAR